MELTRVVISDLHIGNNDDFDIFKDVDKQDLLLSFIDFLRSSDRAIELIINGDFVDFLQLKPWEDHGRGIALQKVQAIVTGSKPCFECLGSLLDGAENSMTVLLGNHDVELAYPEVWAEVEKALVAGKPARAGRLQFLFGRTVYRFACNGVGIHVEHGNADDPWNSLNYTQLYEDAETHAQEFRYPPGTEFVYQIMNGFKEKYRFVDLLKPEVPAVPLLLMALSPAQVMKSLPDFARNLMQVIINGFLQKLRSRLVGGLMDASDMGPTSAPEQLARTMAEQYGVVAGKVTQADVDALHDYLTSTRTTGAIESLGPVDFSVIKQKLVLSALACLERYTPNSESGAYFQANHDGNMFAKYAAQQLKGIIRVVVLGHTHEPLTARFTNGVYINSGTWADRVSLPTPGNESAWLGGIEENTFDRKSFPTYVMIAPAKTGVDVSLNEWHGQEERLWPNAAKAGVL